MLARGKLPAVPLPAVQAYIDNKRFGCFPLAGGSFDQPPALMSEMHEVAAVVERELAPKRKKTDARSKRSSR